MSASKKKNKKKKVETPEDRMKYEIAKELGLAERVRKSGWGSLTAAETGRIGGIITTRKKAGKVVTQSGNTLEG
ncbi:MAG: hypothetical protein HPY66_2230 [Firmicutes bacterium]|nr:hypothetical protein [Bacillota bacterium]MDI6705626.1 small, acid-soluble spore protein, alpha/beta type [Bacillota bacterium]